MLRRTNYRGRTVSLAGGIACALALLARDLAPVVATAALVGLYDDLRGDRDPKGFGGHFTSLRQGRLTSGLAKLLLIGGVAVVTLGPLDGLLVAGTANLVNLFDLRPGRALKVVLVAALLAGAWWVAAVAAVLLPFDLRERVMLGDVGANALGAALGVAVIPKLDAGVTLALLVVVVAMTALSEVVSFTAVIERTPPLRWLDRLGRAA
jgi:hypothetical protein